MSTVHPVPADLGPHLYRTLRAPLSWVAFYSAIALPAVYLPLLATGIETTDWLILFFGLLGLHLASLVGGRSYGSDA